MPLFRLITTLIVLLPSSTFAVELRGIILDAVSRQPIGARVYVQDEQGTWFFPRSADAAGSALEYKRKAATASIEMHVTLSPHPFVVDLPPGNYTLRVERGKEYLPVERPVRIAAESVAVTIELRRWFDMAERGWFSGDTHFHRPVAEVPNLLLAEDVNIAFPLSHWVTTTSAGPVSGNKAVGGATTPDTIRVTPRHLIHPLNTEYELFSVGKKSHTLGAFVAIGQQHPIDERAPPVKPIADQLHADGALIDLEKHSWPWSVSIVPLMNVDLFELANNHVWQTEFGFPKWTIEAAGEYMRLERNDAGFTEWGWIDFGFQTYYALLNCGLRLQPTAGTASGVHPVALGFGRVYVQPTGEFSVKSWLAGLKAGRSFVTNGPLLQMTVNDQPLGHVFADAAPNQEYRVRGSAFSLAPIDRVEILVNGYMGKTLKPTSQPREAGGFETSFEAALQLESSGWIAVRVFESHPRGRIRFAHSSPVHVEIPGRPLKPRPEELQYLIGRVEQELARSQAVLDPAAVEEYREALRFYAAMR